MVGEPPEGLLFPAELSELTNRAGVTAEKQTRWLRMVGKTTEDGSGAAKIEPCAVRNAEENLSPSKWNCKRCIRMFSVR